MQGGRGRGNPFFGFGNPFPNFGGMPSFFGGTDPFDDPFFTRPFGGMLSSGPGSPFVDLNSIGASLFGPRTNPFMAEHAPRIHGSRTSLPSNSRGPVIEELTSDDENEQHDAQDNKKNNPRRHNRPDIQPYVEHPDDESEGRDVRRTQFGDDFGTMNHAMMSRPEGHSYSFQSSTVTYGGSNGAYYTSSSTKRSGSDGLRFEEYKEADSVSGQAAHRVSRGIHDKGHTVTRNLKSDGQVDTMQVLHNINEDELGGFEETWKGKARQQRLPGWNDGLAATHERLGEPRRGGWALPSSERSRDHGHVGVRRKPDGGQNGQSSSKISRRH